jgi:glucokinase
VKALEEDGRVVLTLDAGGTNFVFSAMRGAKEIAPPRTRPSRADDLQASLATMLTGFEEAASSAGSPPAAISFAFPGRADSPAGIVGNAHNLAAFEEPVALGPMLEDHFQVPVLIGNDGDLFAYGEALAGFLPHVNTLLAEAGNRKRFRSLFGATMGTGFGGGVVQAGVLHVGDNAGAGEVWPVRNKFDPAACAEDGVSIRAVRKEYARRAGLPPAASPEPQAIFEIAIGRRDGDGGAAREAFRRLGELAGDALAHAVTLLDCAVVIGGGLAGAAPLFMPALVHEMNGRIRCAGREIRRTHLRVYNLEDPAERDAFVRSESHVLPVPGSSRTVCYDPHPRVPVGVSRLGASRATAIGAYAVAIDRLDRAADNNGQS